MPDGTVFGDAGGAGGSTTPGSGYLTELGITNTGLPLCVNDALINAAGGYHQLCMGASSLGGGLISLNAFGGATPTALNFNINGQTYAFPGNGVGNALGPNSSCVGCPAYFNNTVGTLLASHNYFGITQTETGLRSTGENFINLTDSVTTPGVDFFQALAITHTFGGGSGGRNSLEVDSFLTSPTLPTNANRNYVAVFGQMVANSNDGGTGLSFITSKGGIFGGNLFAHLTPAATNMLNLSGEEFDVGAEAGSSVFIKTGIQIVVHPSDGGVHGSTLDSAVAIGNNSSAAGTGWKTAINLTNDFGFQPLTTDGCVICTTLGSNDDIATGIDLSGWFISGYFLKSAGFYVTGAGAASVAGFFNTGANVGPAIQPAMVGSFQSSNFTNGTGEIDYINLQNDAGGHYWYQRSAASGGSYKLLASLSTLGLNVVGGVVTTTGFSQPLATEVDTGPCAAGQINWDANFIYVCTSTNVYKRAALSTY